MIKRPNTNAQRLKRHKRVRAKISGTPEMPRLNVFRSEANIYAQVIDDVNGVTLASASSLDKAIEGYGGNIAAATAVGKLVAERCKAKGIDYKVGKFPLVANGKSLIINGGEGLVKIIADAKYEEVLGMHIIGPRATDLIAEGALALRLEATVDELISTIHSHPTVSESVRECALNVQKRAIHIKN